MKIKLLCSVLAGLYFQSSKGQVLLSGGLIYNQNFDCLSNQPVNAPEISWTDNSMPGMTGWYASRQHDQQTNDVVAFSGYRAGSGTSGIVFLWSFGAFESSDRAFGAISGGVTGTIAYGVRFRNDTDSPVGQISVSYSGEEWRGTTGGVQVLTFSYKISPIPFSSPIDLASNDWTSVSALNFASPSVMVTTGPGIALNGNLETNRTSLPPFILSDAVVAPGQEIFLRWLDIDHINNDHGLAVDDLQVSFTSIPEPNVLAMIVLGGLLMILRRR